MKALHVLLNNDNKPREPLQLFSKLRELKKQEEPVEGVPVVESDASEDEISQQQIEDIRKRLQLFKEQKAREVASLHNKTLKSIEEIVEGMKDQLQYEALCLIKPALKDSIEKPTKPARQMGSTLPGTVQRSNGIQTPGFDFPSSKSKNKELTIDLREFTLGQKEQGSSNRSYRSYKEDDSYVSEFNIPLREPISKKIKNKIMNSQKSKK